MPFLAQVFKVLIASPDDTVEFRDAIEQALRAWNAGHADTGPLVLSQRWDLDLVPEATSSEDAQAVTNRQLVDGADIVLGVFHSQLGSATPRGPSGTAEELTRSVAARKKVHVWFCEALLPYSHDPAQFAMLQEFRRTFPGSYGTFRTDTELKDRVRDALAKDLKDQTLRPGRAVEPRADGAPVPSQLEILSARYGVGEHHVDVTATLRRLVDRDRLWMRVDAEALPEDPAPGKAKFLAVNYTYAGEEDSRAWREGETLALPAPS